MVKKIPLIAFCGAVLVALIYIVIIALPPSWSSALKKPACFYSEEKQQFEFPGIPWLLSLRETTDLFEVEFSDSLYNSADNMDPYSTSRVSSQLAILPMFSQEYEVGFLLKKSQCCQFTFTSSLPNSTELRSDSMDYINGIYSKFCEEYGEEKLYKNFEGKFTYEDLCDKNRYATWIARDSQNITTELSIEAFPGLFDKIVFKIILTYRE